MKSQSLNEKDKKRDRYLRTTYGLSLLQYNELLEKQGGSCAICYKTPEQEGKNLAVDHDHKTREVRGILCQFCNHRLVGRHRNSELLRRIADYVDNHTGYFAPEKKKRKKKRVRRNRS